MHDMSLDEMKTFIMEGTRTGHLATTREDGRPHVAPIWFVMDGDDIVFTAFHTSVKGKNLQRHGYATLSVDEATPPYSFVVLEGPVTLDPSPELSHHWAGIAGEWVLRLTPKNWTGIRDIAL